MAGKLDFLGMENWSKLWRCKCSFSKQVMILEEFEQSDSISLNYILYLLDQRIKLVRTFEVSEVGVVGGFSSSGRAVNSVFKNGTVL